ncbi:MAG: ABC transporter ATP-binding protein [Puniceicoccales bacterium]|jgi:NitT/TauT family transport system ATP-binding protein|nr:ABC transporter ATP-binding protein [Puniceicoccales bacterium]
MPETNVKICASHVGKAFRRDHRFIKVLDDISFSIQTGEFVAILGPSGCGKSTLLNMVAGLEPCEEGHIIVNEYHTDQPERHRMMMFQEAALFPWYNVLGNVVYGLRFKKGLTNAERKTIALYYLRMVGLDHFERAYVHELSGGMKQRVALARALAPNPQILLMDEPFSALDALTCEQLYKDVQKIWNMQHKTVLLVTHNVREAVVLTQRVIVLSQRPGKILKDLPIQLPYPRSVHDVSVSALANELINVLHEKDDVYNYASCT